jgi:hypothetical protein
MWRQFMNSTIFVLGSLSFVALCFYFLALHDIWHDYASPEVWSRAGQNLPSWYSPVNRCPLEWGFLGVGFWIMVAFHVLLVVRLVRNHRGHV